MDQNKNDFFLNLRFLQKPSPHTPYKVQSDKIRS